MTRAPASPAVVLFTLVATPAAAAGLRWTFGWPLLPCLAMAAVCCTSLLWIESRRSDETSTLWLLVPGLLAAVLLFHPLFEGMPSVGGGDAGNHLSIHHHFLRDDVKTYFGFAAGYALMGLFEALHFDTFEAFRGVWYFVFFCVTATFGFFCASATRSKAVVLAALLAAGWFLFIGPEIHYQQADGFFAHGYSMALLLTFVVAAHGMQTRWVILASLAFFAALRFSYGLNLGALGWRWPLH
jgi:hypothetical protein